MYARLGSPFGFCHDRAARCLVRWALASHDPQLAIPVLREVTQMEPHNQDYKLLLADTLANRAGAFKPEMAMEAQRLYEALLRKNPGLARAHAGIGKVWEGQNKDQESLKNYLTAVNVVMASLRQIVRLDPQNPQAYLDLAQMARRMEGSQSAVKVLKQGLKQLPGNTDLEKALWQMERDL